MTLKNMEWETLEMGKDFITRRMLIGSSHHMAFNMVTVIRAEDIL